MQQDESVVSRDLKEADVPALARLHVRTFRETHGGGPSEATREEQWRGKLASGQLLFCIVLETGAGELVGFASGELRDHHELAEFRGELNKIYVLRAYERRGLGRRLLCLSAQRFLAAGVGSMLLFGDARSPSNGFYEAMGGERLYAASGEFHGGYGWPDLSRLAARCTGSWRS